MYTHTRELPYDMTFIFARDPDARAGRRRGVGGGRLGGPLAVHASPRYDPRFKVQLPANASHTYIRTHSP